MVELFDVRGNAESGHGVEHAEGVTPLDEFVCVSFMEGAGNEQDDVVDHVGIAVRCYEQPHVSRRTKTTYVM